MCFLSYEFILTISIVSTRVPTETIASTAPSSLTPSSMPSFDDDAIGKYDDNAATKTTTLSLAPTALQSTGTTTPIEPTLVTIRKKNLKNTPTLQPSMSLSVSSSPSPLPSSSFHTTFPDELHNSDVPSSFPSSGQPSSWTKLQQPSGIPSSLPSFDEITTTTEYVKCTNNNSNQYFTTEIYLDVEGNIDYYRTNNKENLLENIFINAYTNLFISTTCDPYLRQILHVHLLTTTSTVHYHTADDDNYGGIRRRQRKLRHIRGRKKKLIFRIKGKCRDCIHHTNLFDIGIEQRRKNRRRQRYRRTTTSSIATQRRDSDRRRKSIKSKKKERWLKKKLQQPVNQQRELETCKCLMKRESSSSMEDDFVRFFNEILESSTSLSSGSRSSINQSNDHLRIINVDDTNYLNKLISY